MLGRYLCTYLLFTYLFIHSFIHLLILANDTFAVAGQRSSSVPHSPRILPPKSLGIERIHFRKSSINDQFVDTRQSRWEVTSSISDCLTAISSFLQNSLLIFVLRYFSFQKGLFCKTKALKLAQLFVGDSKWKYFLRALLKKFYCFLDFKVYLIYVKL